MSITEDRWRKAQQWESQFWREYQEGLASRSLRKPLWKWPVRALMSGLGLRDYNTMPIGNDSNQWWIERLQLRAVLPPRIGNLLELGCGPHTNTRLIMHARPVEHAVCSDPLLSDYLALPRSWLRWAVTHGAVCSDNHPAEECPFADSFFDVAVMINVLDHVRDPELCFSQITRVVAPGGLVVLGNDVKPGETADERDIGHPHALSAEWLDRLALASFKPIVHEVLPFGHGRVPGPDGCWLFVGRKM